MDYARIYKRFIDDRRQREASFQGYMERHHIVPRCMGGGDAPENLVQLTAEDHYFAHLLLAYAHGGKNWGALQAMCHLANAYSLAQRSRISNRMQFGHVRRALAAHYREILSGPHGKISDKRKFELRHFDGRSAVGNRFELADLTGVNRQQISAVLRGAKKNAHGWYSPLNNPDGLTRSQILSKKLRSDKVLTLHHLDGRVWSGTKWEFRKQFGAGLSFQHSVGGVKGWYRSKKDAESYADLRKAALNAAVKARGSIHGAKNPNADPAIYKFKVVATGEVIAATKTEIRAKFRIKSANLCAIFSGRQTQTGGAALA